MVSSNKICFKNQSNTMEDAQLKPAANWTKQSKYGFIHAGETQQIKLSRGDSISCLRYFDYIEIVSKKWSPVFFAIERFFSTEFVA